MHLANLYSVVDVFSVVPRTITVVSADNEFVLQFNIDFLPIFLSTFNRERKPSRYIVNDQAASSLIYK